MEYAADDLAPRERYKLLAGFVLPRPIAWVTTVGPTGVVNAAPFSFFNVFCEDPPLCMFAVNLRPDGRVKDTLVNIQRSGEFVVNIADVKLAPSSKVAAPRLADTPWAMECKTWKIIDANHDRQLIMGEGINFYIRDE